MYRSLLNKYSKKFNLPLNLNLKVSSVLLVCIMYKINMLQMMLSHMSNVLQPQ